MKSFSRPPALVSIEELPRSVFHRLLAVKGIAGSTYPIVEPEEASDFLDCSKVYGALEEMVLVDPDDKLRSYKAHLIHCSFNLDGEFQVAVPKNSKQCAAASSVRLGAGATLRKNTTNYLEAADRHVTEMFQWISVQLHRAPAEFTEDTVGTLRAEFEKKALSSAQMKIERGLATLSGAMKPKDHEGIEGLLGRMPPTVERVGSGGGADAWLQEDPSRGFASGSWELVLNNEVIVKMVKAFPDGDPRRSFYDQLRKDLVRVDKEHALKIMEAAKEQFFSSVDEDNFIALGLKLGLELPPGHPRASPGPGRT